MRWTAVTRSPSSFARMIARKQDLIGAAVEIEIRVGAVAFVENEERHVGVPGLILVLPLAGVVMVVAGTIGGIIDDPRLRARHGFAKRLRSKRINADLQC